jgi:hypothetical protein
MLVVEGCSLFETSLICGAGVVSIFNIAEGCVIGRTRCKTLRLYAV